MQQPYDLKICLKCDSQFIKKKYESETYWTIKKFCSKSCAAKYHIKEHLPIMLKAREGKVPWNKGVKQSKELLEKLSVIRKGKIWSEDRKKKYEEKFNLLPNNIKVKKLKKDLRMSNHYINWRLEVFKKDNFKCTCCGYKSCKKINKKSDIEAHHIYPFSKIINEEQIKTFTQAYENKKLWNLENGKTLCKTCHKKVHATGL